MSSNHKEFTNPIVLFLSFAFIAYLVYWVFVDNYIKGEEIGKYNPHEIQVAESGSETVENKYSLETPTSTSIAYGKSQYAIYCATCHGNSGLGDGPGSNSVPPPRNFTKANEFKFGITYSSLLSTLKNGSPGTSMAPFDYLVDDDKTAIIHFMSEFIPGRSFAEIGSNGGSTAQAANGESVANVVAPQVLETIELSEKEISSSISKNASQFKIGSFITTASGVDQIVQILSGAAKQVDVSPYSKLYVPVNKLDKEQIMASVSDFVNFINSDFVYAVTKKSFGTLTSSEARQMFDSVKSKLN